MYFLSIVFGETILMNFAKAPQKKQNLNLVTDVLR